uniref:protrudin isoform X2 n=1 Tax=Myxine glutinosa TaxID=7769 RepID=UPI00358EAB4C
MSCRPEVCDRVQGDSPRVLRDSGRLDVLAVAVTVFRLRRQLEPVLGPGRAIRDLARWTSPRSSLLCCFIVNLLLLLLSEVVWATLVVMLLVVPALLGCVQARSRSFRSTEEQTALHRRHIVQHADLDHTALSRREAIAQTKEFLVLLQEWMTWVCEILQGVCDTFSWEDQMASLQFYSCLGMVLFTFYFASFRWMLLLTLNLLFFCNKAFVKALFQWCNSKRVPQASPQPSSQADSTVDSKNWDKTPIDASAAEAPAEEVFYNPSRETLQLTSGEGEVVLLEEEFKDAIEGEDEGPWHLVELDPVNEPQDVAGSNGPQGRGEPIRRKVVSKLAELKRRHYPPSSLGTCCSCNVAFFVLKKRHCCSNCGNGFCSRCCSYRVTKSAMGATAPNAQQETVPVCSGCYSKLNK